MLDQLVTTSERHTVTGMIRLFPSNWEIIVPEMLSEERLGTVEDNIIKASIKSLPERDRADTTKIFHFLAVFPEVQYNTHVRDLILAC